MTIESVGGTPRPMRPVGLEDVTPEDYSIPRFSIVMDDGVFRNNATQETHEYLHVIMLGVVRQRIMWNRSIEEGDAPLCKSNDFVNGYPNDGPDVPARNRFPWEDSAWGEGGEADAGRVVAGLKVLRCDNCSFSQWGAEKTPPPCREVHTYAMLYAVPGTSDWLPALLSLKSTSIKPSRAFLSSFLARGQSMFTQITTLQLEKHKRGQTKYSVICFSEAGQTDESNYAKYESEYYALRDFVQRAPRPSVGDGGQGGATQAVGD
jgi:hypothetical protein